MLPFDIVQVMKALAGVDFTAVHFPKGYDVEEKAGIFASEFKTPAPSTDNKSDLHRAFAIQIPALAYSQGQNLNSKASENNANAHAQAKRKQRGSSIYSEPNGMPILLSSSPPLVSEFGPAPARLSRLSSSKSGSQKRSTTSTSRGDGWGDKTQRELDRAVRTLTPEMPALPKRTMTPPIFGPPGIERPEAATTVTFSPILFKQPPSSLPGYAPVYPPSPSSIISDSNSSLSPPPGLPSPPLPSVHSARSEGSVPSSRLERSPSASSKWSIESPVEMNLKRKKLQKLGMGAGLPSTPRPNNRK